MFYLIKHRHGHTNTNKISLTLDDGPSKWTLFFLDKLDELGIKATFFVIPENVYAIPNVAKDIIKRGHEVGVHVAQPDEYSLFKSFFKRVNERAIDNSINAISKICGVKPRFFRPSPEMSVSMGLKKAIEKRSLIPILASAYSIVTRTNEKQILDITKNLKGNDIILLHDGHDLHRDSYRPQGDLEILDEIVIEAKKRDLEFTLVSNLIGENPYQS